MVNYREILRLRGLGHNITQIANAIHSSRHTVREVEKLADEKGIRWPLEEELTNQNLYELLYPERLDKAQVYLQPDCPYIHKPKFTGIFYNYIPSYVGDGIESETIQDPFRRTKLIG